MAVVMAASSSIVSTAMNGYSSQKDVIAGYALAVARDTQTNGLIALAKPCFQFLIVILS